MLTPDRRRRVGANVSTSARSLEIVDHHQVRLGSQPVLQRCQGALDGEGNRPRLRGQDLADQAIDHVVGRQGRVCGGLDAAAGMEDLLLGADPGQVAECGLFDHQTMGQSVRQACLAYATDASDHDQSARLERQHLPAQRGQWAVDADQLAGRGQRRPLCEDRLLIGSGILFRTEQDSCKLFDRLALHAVEGRL